MKYLLAALFFINAYSFSLHNHQLTSSKGKEVKFESFKGKPILMVNIATKCGYTPQLENLEKFHQKYKDKIVVIGVPSNDFGGQTPQSDSGVVEFCKRNYGVTFPIMKKVPVSGSESHPLFKKLAQLNDNKQIKWNFEKFLFDKNGGFVKNYPSSIDPLDKELLTQVDKLL